MARSHWRSFLDSAWIQDADSYGSIVQRTKPDVNDVLCYISHLGKAAVIVGHHSGVRTVQLLNNLKALVELCEDVHHRAGEQGVLRRLLELQAEGREDKL